MDSAALAESQLELEEERAAQGLSNEPAPSFEVEEVDDWEVRGGVLRSAVFGGLLQPLFGHEDFGVLFLPFYGDRCSRERCVLLILNVECLPAGRPLCK